MRKKCTITKCTLTKKAKKKALNNLKGKDAELYLRFYGFLYELIDRIKKNYKPLTNESRLKFLESKQKERNKNK